MKTKHINFYGFPVDGDTNLFAKKIAGIKTFKLESTKRLDSMLMLEGYLYGIHATFGLSFTPKSNTIYSASLFEELPAAWLMDASYEIVRDLFIGDWGDPIETHEDDEYKQSVFRIEGGRVSLSTECIDGIYYVLVIYTDTVNSELNKREQL